MIIKLHFLLVGEVREVKIAQTSGYELLDGTALEAIQKAHRFLNLSELATSSLIVNILIQFTLKYLLLTLLFVFLVQIE